MWNAKFLACRKLDSMSLTCKHFAVNMHIYKLPMKLNAMIQPSRVCLVFALVFYHFIQSNTILTMPASDILWPSKWHSMAQQVVFNGWVSGILWPSKWHSMAGWVAFNGPVNGLQWPSKWHSIHLGVALNGPVSGIQWSSKWHSMGSQCKCMYDMPFHAMPSHAMPCLAMPCRAPRPQRNCVPVYCVIYTD